MAAASSAKSPRMAWPSINRAGSSTVGSMIGIVVRLPSLAPYGDRSRGHRQPGGAQARVLGRELLEVVGQIGDRPARHGRDDVVDRVGGKTAPRLPLGSLGVRFRPVVDPPVDPLACPLLFASVAQLADGRGQKIDAPALLIFRRPQFGNGTGLLRDLLIQGRDPPLLAGLVRLQFTNLSWLNLVRRSAGVVDGVEDLDGDRRGEGIGGAIRHPGRQLYGICARAIFFRKPLTPLQVSTVGAEDGRATMNPVPARIPYTAGTRSRPRCQAALVSWAGAAARTYARALPALRAQAELAGTLRTNASAALIGWPAALVTWSPTGSSLSVSRSVE